MNVGVFLLFFNAIISVVLAAIIVFRILKKEYKPRITEFKKKKGDK